MKTSIRELKHCPFQFQQVLLQTASCYDMNIKGGGAIVSNQPMNKPCYEYL